LRGKELWIRAEQMNGRRILNYRWIVGESWEQPSTISTKQIDVKNSSSALIAK